MSSAASVLSPCIVLGVESQIGLGIVRELGRAGVPVIGIAHEREAIGLASRYLLRGVVVDPPRSTELVNAIRALGDEFGHCILLAVSEANLVWLAQHRHSFGTVCPVVPAEEKLAMVLDKQRTLKAAKEVGIATPDTVEIKSMEHARAISKEFKFPAVLKWKDPNIISKKLATNNLELLKAEYINSPEEFMTAARRYEPLAAWPIVQAYCAGRGLGQFFYMYEGQAVRRFQHVRIAEWPPEGGFSSVCDALPLSDHQDLQEKSIALLRHIGWEGVAMVEYRWDPATDESVLMEINGRYWGSYPLAVHCNASFALLSYYLGGGLRLPALPSLRSNIRCRMINTEVKRLARIFFRSKLIADRSFKINRGAEVFRFLSDFFRPRVRYYVWDISDPRPYFADIKNLLTKLITR